MRQTDETKKMISLSVTVNTACTRSSRQQREKERHDQGINKIKKSGRTCLGGFSFWCRKLDSINGLGFPSIESNDKNKLRGTVA